MTYSMTGYGKANFHLKNKNFIVEIKTLNSKQTDLYVRMPNAFQDIEIAIRNLLSQELLRGKINIQIQVANNANVDDYVIDKQVLNDYYEQLNDVSLPKDNVLQALLSLPNVVMSKQDEFTKQDIDQIMSTVKNACEDVMEFRAQEGHVLQIDLKNRIEKIVDYKNEIAIIAPDRITRLKEKIAESLKSIENNVNYNKDRFEQELIYYIEKLDVTEEFVRLDAHCNYFIEVLNSSEATKGKKLNFISQELGREINTLGSKANDASMQKYVVQMKDELEKIKEQVNNIL